MSRSFAAALAMICLSACTTVPVTTMLTLAKWDVTNSDPAQIRAAIRLPVGIGLQPGNPVLGLSAWSGEQRIDDEIVLEELDSPVAVAPLRRWQKRGFRIRAFRIPPQDSARLNQFRARAKAANLNHFSLNIHAKGCREGVDPAPVLLTTFLKTSSAANYIVLTRETDLSKLVPGNMPHCGAFATVPE